MSPPWADELRRRYLAGEAHLFVLHGNVHDVVLVDAPTGAVLVPVADFLTSVVLEKKDLVLRYDVSTGCRFTRKPARVDGIEELVVARGADKILPAIERVLVKQKNVGVLLEYAETIVPAFDGAFASESDRQAVVTLQRWSLARELEANDNVVVISTEIAGELHPKIMANPRVAAVRVPLPSKEERVAVIKMLQPSLEPEWLDRLAEGTAGLKAVQLRAILAAPPAAAEDPAERKKWLDGLVGDPARAAKLGALTAGMSRDEVRELVGAAGATPPAPDRDRAHDEVLARIGQKKREILERECFGLIEFVDPKHDFSVVGGIDEVKKELSGIAKAIREGRRARVPMGLLFTGPMGTGKTFVAEAFVKESGLTGIKLKNFRSKWVGSTESNLERILGVVQGIGNVIVILDEADRSFGGGGDDGEGGDGGTGSRVIARLKEFMSDTSNRGRVLFILMTNRPDKLDVDIKRAGRLDRKIPFLYPQTADEVEMVFAAQLRKHKLKTTIEFPRDRGELTDKIIGYSNADFESLAMAAGDLAAETGPDAPIEPRHLAQAIADYLPSRDVEMLEYMELLAVFEASNRRMLPAKYARLTLDELQERLARLKSTCGNRR